MTSAETDVVLNGIDGSTGTYLIPSFSIAEGDARARAGEPRTSESEEWLRHVVAARSRSHLGLPYDVPPEIVSKAGWGLLCPSDEADVLRAALAPLLNFRKEQVTQGRFRDDLVYLPGETWPKWLARHGVSGGTVAPDHVPYYLLIAGDPRSLPFEFCHQLDTEYAVGRLHFDRVEDYTRYAQSVVAYETAAVVQTRQEAVFFGPRHDFDRATQLSADFLINPLADGIPAGAGTAAAAPAASKAGFRTRKIWGENATKETLRAVFQQPAGEVPALLFTASHGMGWPLGHARQKSHSGALLCQDWPALGSIAPDHYFAAADVSDEAQIHGMVTFHFACFSAGTPERDRYLNETGTPPRKIAEDPFVAALPKRLLSHPNGGALACVGHVDRAWSYSIRPRNTGAQIQPFQNFVGRVLTGQPVGYAMKDLNERFAVLGTDLSSKLREAKFGKKYDEGELAKDWIERNDAEGYLLLGDPAVALRANVMA